MENQNLENKEMIKQKIEKFKQIVKFLSENTTYDFDKHKAYINGMIEPQFNNIIDNIPITKNLSDRYRKIFFYDIVQDLNEILDLYEEEINEFENIEDFQEYLFDKINDYADQNTEIYYDDLKDFITENIDLFDVLEDNYQIYDYFNMDYTDRNKYDINLWNFIRYAQYFARIDFYQDFILTLLNP